MGNLIWHSEIPQPTKVNKISQTFLLNIINFYDLCKRKAKMNKKQGEIFMFFFPVPRSSLMKPRTLRIALSCLTELVPDDACFKKKFFIKTTRPYLASDPVATILLVNFLILIGLYPGVSLFPFCPLQKAMKCFARSTTV